MYRTVVGRAEAGDGGSLSIRVSTVEMKADVGSLASPTATPSIDELSKDARPAAKFFDDLHLDVSRKYLKTDLHIYPPFFIFNYRLALPKLVIATAAQLHPLREIRLEEYDERA